MRELSYAQAINEAFHQLMERDPRVMVIGQGVNNPWYVGTTAAELDRRFGPTRVIDPPVSENGMNGVAIGAALTGLRPIVIHPRVDFLLMGVEQLFNQAANWSHVFGGQQGVPLVIRAIINRGGQQGAQHSQALQALFMHIPGLKVVMPATPRDAKGLLVAAVQDGNPVVYIDDRWLYDERGEVPEEMYSTPIGKAAVVREGKDVTIAATSFMVKESMQAAEILRFQGVDAEVVDVRSLKPLDDELICASVRKTGRLVVADAAWRTAGAAAEIAACVTEKAFAHLRAPILRVTLPDVPAPSSPTEEKAFYRYADDVVSAVKTVMRTETGERLKEERRNHHGL